MSLEEFSLAGRVALVTGAARGLGFEIARAFAAAGATVAVNGRSRENAEAACNAIAQAGGIAQPLVFDVGDPEACERELRAFAKSSGRLDILVNNVGMRMRAPLEEIAPSDLRRLLDVDVVSAFTLSRVAADFMRTAGGGRIIMISSISAMQGRRGDAAYITAKGAINALTLALAAELGPHGITCNAIMPGSFNTQTNMEVLATPRLREWMGRNVPLGRAGEPHEIGGAAVFLASRAASYVTGAILPVDGGCLMASDL